MFSNKDRTLLKVIVSTKSSEINRIKKIGVIFRVAVAIRKFQRFESDRFKNSVEYNFDREAALEELRCLYAGNEGFFRQESVKLFYFIRKFSLTFDDLNSIEGEHLARATLLQCMYEFLEDVCKHNGADEQRPVYFLCLSLKYLTRNSSSAPLNISSIVKLIGICNSSVLATELVALLAHVIEKTGNVLGEALSAELENLVLNLPELSQEAKAFFFSKLERNKSIKHHAAGVEEADADVRLLRPMTIRHVKKNKQMVTKTIQTVKSKVETKNSEETDFKFLNLSDCMKNRSRRLNCNAVLEPVETVRDESGNDRSWHRSTWAEVINLFSLSQDGILKASDKDDYLPSKLLGDHYYVDTFLNKDAKIMYSFFINRMCVSIFFKASKKQRLNDAAIDKLLKCVTSNFDHLLSVLELKTDYVDMFVNRIFLRYWDLKKLTGPGIVVDFVTFIMKRTTEEFLVQGWFYYSNDVRKKFFDREEVEKFIVNEINKVRREAIRALYNCATRSKEILIPRRVDTIHACLANEDQKYDDSDFRDHIFKVIELAESLEDFNYTEVFRSYLEQLTGESTRNMEAILRFISNQAKDLKRCQQLFDQDVIRTLIGLLGSNSGFTNRLKENVMEIMNSYLEHELTAEISEDNLKLLLSNIFESNDFVLINAALTSLLLITDKGQSLPLTILRMLVKNFNIDLSCTGKDCSSYILFILSRAICGVHAPVPCFLDYSDDVEKISEKLQCDLMADVNDDGGENDQHVKFEKPSEKNRHNSSNQISLLTAKIILKSTENKVWLSTVTIDNLLLTLHSSNEDDKQMKIATAKCLYYVSKYMSFESGHLSQMQEFINSVVYDVGVYIQAAYLNGCVKVAFAGEKRLDQIHLENISSLYVPESLRLGVCDYESEINKSLFKMLLYEAGKQEFNDKNLFLLFERILSLNEKYAAQVLQILIVYTREYHVPETTVRTLENVLGFSEHFEKALQVLQNLILGGQSLFTRKTLNIFVEYLYVSINSRLRFYSFKLLEKVSHCQELPDDVFGKFELAKAGFALGLHHAAQANLADKQLIIEYIRKQTETGMQLPIDTKLALEKEIGHRDVLRIFANLSKNRQIIPLNLLDALIKMFDPGRDDAKEDNIILISIFVNAAKNNQTLPVPLLKKLEGALRKKGLQQEVLPVFIYLAQKGERLSKYVNDRLLDKLMNEEDLVLKQELLSSLGSMIDANKGEIKLYQMKINRILVHEMKSDNFNIHKLCIKVIGKLVTVTKELDEELLEELIQIGTNLDSNKMVRSEIKSLIESLDENCNSSINKKRYREKIRLANLQCSSNEELLSSLSGFVNLEDGFFEQNYRQLKQIIDHESLVLQQRALDILCKSKNKPKMTDELLESVAVLYESTMSDSLKTSCLKLFQEAAVSGKTLKSRAREIWNEKVNRDENVKKFFLSQVYKELKHDLQLSDGLIADILKLIKISEKISDIDNPADLIQLIVKENSACFNSQPFVELIEKCLLKKRGIETTLPCYCRIIKERKLCEADCLKMLVEYFNEDLKDTNLPVHFVTHLMEVMYCASKLKVIQLPDDCVKLVEENLYHSDATVRGYSFRTLKIITSSDGAYVKSRKFDDWCKRVVENLALRGQVKEFEYWDLLEIIASVNFVDAEVFKKNPSKIWKRELLNSSMFESFKVSQLDQIQFYTSWLLVEERFCYHKSCKILNMLQMSKFKSFAQVVELISIMPEIPFDEILQRLSVYGPAPYKDFKQDWCLRKIKAHLPSKDGINEIYLNRLAEKFCSGFDVGCIGKMLRSITSVDNLRAFEDLIDFCLWEKIELDDMSFENCQLTHLKCLIEAKHLCSLVKRQPQSDAELANLLEMMQILLNEGWNFDKLREIVNAFHLPKLKNLTEILSTIHQYNLSPHSSFGKCQQILAETETMTMAIRKLNKLAIENHFQLEGKIKDLSELLDELLDKKSNHSLANADRNALDITRQIFENQKDKLDWNEKQISLWARDMKEHREGKQFTDYEAIAVILRANFLITGHTLTNTQILCSLIALSGEQNLKGKLLEVATGEGKSTIVCILAIINALRGKQIDVITSSPVLAERDAKQKAKLYRMFNLTCSDNNDKTVYMRGAKACYKADIVYGEVSQFQFDILRDNYSKLGTLGGRKCMTAIVDEVDSMLIDDSSKIARLSSTVAGMDHFQAIYVFIWQRLVSIKEKFIMFSNKMYFIDGKIGFENGKITLEFADASDNNNIVKIFDLEGYLQNTHDISRVGEVVGDDLDNYLRKSLENYLDCQVEANQVYIPSNFTEFFRKQKLKWIFNAIEALNYQQNVHYVVQDGQIKPVDYYSTGIVQSSTNWSDGLHQFLQLKHNLKMTSETLTTNFLSNIGFINKYRRVYGLTGTLGSETAREVLKNVYNVELVNVPQRRQRQYLELEPVIVQGEANWLKEITSAVMLEVKKERGILIICETIEHANRIEELLKNKCTVKLYTMNDMNQEKSVEMILPGEVIIATNLAGRGTDIQTDKVEVSGGLHVIVTFLPSNQRVEDQAFGRTARQGKRGTGLMILNAHNLVGYANTTETAKDTKRQRDSIESNQLKEFEKHELKLIQLKDKLFDRFCAFLNNNIRCTIRKEHNSYMRNVVNSFTELLPTVYESNILAAVEEQWAMFLRRLDDGEIQHDDAEDEFKSLIDRLQKDFESNMLIKNPHYFTCIAFDIIVNEWSLRDAWKAEKALDYFKKAIELEERRTSKEQDQKLRSHLSGESDKCVPVAEASKKAPKQGSSVTTCETACGAGAAHFGVAWCLILMKETDYKNKALASFTAAMQCLSNEMSVLNTMQILLQQKQVGFVSSDLYKQLNAKATILGSFLNSIQGCMDAITRSKRLIDLVASRKQGEENTVVETVRHFSEQERNDEKTAFKSKDVELSSKESYSLVFNHLTVGDDSWMPLMDGTRDQAVITLRKAFEKSKVATKFLRSRVHCSDYSYNDVRIKLKQVDLARVRSALFSRDKEFKDLTREMAIAKLKEERTYGHAIADTSSFSTNLTISSIDERKLNEEHNDKQINEIIRIIEDLPISDANLRFDIVIKEANENDINELFKSNGHCEDSMKLNVQFNNLDQDATKGKISAIAARSVNIEFVLNKLNLSKLIEENEQLKYGKLFIGEKNMFEKVGRRELLKRISQLETDDSPCFIVFEDLTGDEANKIVANCHQDVMFAVSFNDIHNCFDSVLKDGQANFCFDNMNRKIAELVIQVLRKESFEFSLEFNNLTDKQVKYILEHASLEQEDMAIRKVKSLRDSYMQGAVPTLELFEFAAKGIEHIIEINEKQFVPWRSVIAVAVIGSCQVIIGGALIATGFGASVGMGFITEGLADMFTAYRAYSSRQFHWSDYCKQKAISLAISAVSMGYAKCKESIQNAAKGVEALATGAGKEVLEQAGTQVLSNSGQTMIKTGQNLKSLAYKYVGVKAGEAAVREGLNTGIQCLSTFSLQLVKPEICESIQSRLRLSFNNTSLMSLLRKMYAITGSGQLQSRVEQIVADTINPRHDFARRQWDTIGLPLLKGILSDSSKFGSNASMTIRIIGTLNGLYQLQGLVENVVSELVKQLRLIDSNTMTISLVLHKYLKMNKENALCIANQMKAFDIFDELDNFKVCQSDISEGCEELKARIDNFAGDWGRSKEEVILQDLNVISNSLEDDVKRSIDFVKSFYKNFVEIELDSFSTIIQSVSSLIAEQLMHIIDSQLIQPWSTLAVSAATDFLSKQIQHHYLVDREQNSERQDLNQKKYEELQNKKELTTEEQDFIANYGKFRTFGEQIDSNAKDYCIARSQCEMAHHAMKETNSGSSVSSDKAVRETADDVRNGKAANLGVILATAKSNGINLKVVDDPSYVKTQNDIDNGVEVVYVRRGENNEIGHAYYMNSNGQFVDTRSEGNNCFFAAFTQILESKGITKSIVELRHEAAEQIESNSKNYSKVLAAENWIRDRHPDAANGLLFSAGLYIDKKTGRIIVEDEDIETFDKSVSSDQGDKWAKRFKEASAREDTYEGADAPDEKTARAHHHIIPQEEIKDTIITSNQNLSTLEERKNELEEYANLPHIKEPLSYLIKERAEGEKPTLQDGKKLHSAILWNPNNVVRGPLPRERGDDPHSGVDHPLLGIQSPDYRASVDNFLNKPSFEEFGKIPKPQSANYAARQATPAPNDSDKGAVRDVSPNQTPLSKSKKTNEPRKNPNKKDVGVKWFVDGPSKH